MCVCVCVCMCVCVCVCRAMETIHRRRNTGELRFAWTVMAALDDKSHYAHLRNRSRRAALLGGLRQWHEQHLRQMRCHQLYLKLAGLRASHITAASLGFWRFRQHRVQEVRAAVCRMLLAIYQRLARQFLGAWRASAHHGVIVRVAHWRLAAKMQRALQARLISEWHRAHLFLNRVRHHTEGKRRLRSQHLARNLLGAWRIVSTDLWRRKQRMVRLHLSYLRLVLCKCLMGWWRFAQGRRLVRLQHADKAYAANGQDYARHELSQDRESRSQSILVQSVQSSLVDSASSRLSPKSNQNLDSSQGDREAALFHAAVDRIQFA